MSALIFVTLADPKNSLGLDAVTLMALSLSLLSFSTVVLVVLNVVEDNLSFSVVLSSSVVLGNLSVEEAEKVVEQSLVILDLISFYLTNQPLNGVRSTAGASGS